MEKFKSLSPREGAEYYMENRSDNAFLDTLYADSIMPAVLQCNYFDLDSVNDVLKETEFTNEIQPVLDSCRNDLTERIRVELDSSIVKQKEVFSKCYLPSLEMSIDSMLEEDVGEIMSKYAGGFMNFRKLAFWFGRDRNDFKKMFWEKFDTLKYTEQVKSYVETFLSSVKDAQETYCKDLTGEDFGVSMSVEAPPFPIGLSQSTLSYVKDYTSKQSSEMIGEAVKDYAVPLALGLATGGTGAVAAKLYDVGSTAYDVSQMVKDIENAKVDEDEMVKYICSHDLAYQIRNYYLNKWTDGVYAEIDRSNEELYNFILSNL